MINVKVTTSEGEMEFAVPQKKLQLVIDLLFEVAEGAQNTPFGTDIVLAKLARGG